MDNGKVLEIDLHAKKLTEIDGFAKVSIFKLTFDLFS